jgi:WD40 repeat protein
MYWTTQVISGHLGWVRSIAFDPANEWFCTGSADRTIKVNFIYPAVANWNNSFVFLILSCSRQVISMISWHYFYSLWVFQSVNLMFNYLLWQWPTCHRQWNFVRPHLSRCYEPNFFIPFSLALSLGSVWLSCSCEKSCWGLWAVSYEKNVVGCELLKAKNHLVKPLKAAKRSSIYIFTVPSESR